MHVPTIKHNFRSIFLRQVNSSILFGRCQDHHDTVVKVSEYLGDEILLQIVGFFGVYDLSKLLEFVHDDGVTSLKD